MTKNNHAKSLVFFSRTGCLLPLLIAFNLFFGWIFLKPLYWLSLEAVLILFFVVNSYIMARKILRSASGKSDGVIDVKGEVVEDRPKLK